jgi:hypothetical protein
MGVIASAMPSLASGHEECETWSRNISTPESSTNAAFFSNDSQLETWYEFVASRTATSRAPLCAYGNSQKVPAWATGAQEGLITSVYLTKDEFCVLAQLSAKKLSNTRHSVPPFGIDVFEGTFSRLGCWNTGSDSVHREAATSFFETTSRHSEVAADGCSGINPSRLTSRASLSSSCFCLRMASFPCLAAQFVFRSVFRFCRRQLSATCAAYTPCNCQHTWTNRSIQRPHSCATSHPGRLDAS